MYLPRRRRFTVSPSTMSGILSAMASSAMPNSSGSSMPRPRGGSRSSSSRGGGRSMSRGAGVSRSVSAVSDSRGRLLPRASSSGAPPPTRGCVSGPVPSGPPSPPGAVGPGPPGPGGRTMPASSRSADSSSARDMAPKSSSPPRPAVQAAARSTEGGRSVMSSRRATWRLPPRRAAWSWCSASSASTSRSRAPRGLPPAASSPSPWRRAAQSLKASQSRCRTSSTSSSRIWHFLAKTLQPPTSRWPVARSERMARLARKLARSARRSIST
mmetsp:Transcript_24183/g.75976  ORF Transcript_24183/g.75976 Transcript_24183/m.75976 type:complete len:270 (-) Transcript_24183:181-990(-)